MIFLSAGIVALAAIFFVANSRRASSGAAGAYPYQVADPAVGADAPPIKLASTSGGTFDLASLRGKTVLLYFQEGLSCQPCWDQLKDIEKSQADFQALGIDQVVAITTDPIDLLKQKAADERLSTPVLSDAGLQVSQAYNANRYGMMGASRDGHSFIVVGPDGRIRWRADYGGAPKYTMYVPAPNLIADLRSGLGGGAE